MDRRWRMVIPIGLASAIALLCMVPVSGLGMPAIAAVLVAAVIVVAGIAWLVVDVYFWKPLRQLAAQQLKSSPISDNHLERDPLARLENLFNRAREDAYGKQQTITQAHEHLFEVRRALQESEERYALAVRGANDGLWEWDLKSDRIYLSPRWTGMLGFGDGEFSDSVSSWKAQIFPADREGVEGALQAHLSGDTPRFESEHRVIHKDGRHRWVLSRGMAIRHANGAAYRVVGLDTEITQFKRVEEVMYHVAQGTALASGEEFFRQMVRHFALALGVRVVWVTRCMDIPVTRMRTVACWEAGEFTQKEYALESTPCKRVIELGEQYFIPQDLSVLYPNELRRGLHSFLGIPIFGSAQKILGHLVFKDDKKMDDSILMNSVFQIFTARAGIELERLEAKQAVLQVARNETGLDASQRLEKIVNLLSA